MVTRSKRDIILRTHACIVCMCERACYILAHGQQLNIKCHAIDSKNNRTEKSIGTTCGSRRYGNSNRHDRNEAVASVEQPLRLFIQLKRCVVLVDCWIKFKDNKRNTNMSACAQARRRCTIRLRIALTISSSDFPFLFEYQFVSKSTQNDAEQRAAFLIGPIKCDWTSFGVSQAIAYAPAWCEYETEAYFKRHLICALYLNRSMISSENKRRFWHMISPKSWLSISAHQC